MVFLLVIFLLAVVSAWQEARNPLWLTLSSKWGKDWRRFSWFSGDSLYVWNDFGDKIWFNYMHIDICEDGIFISPPFFKRYIDTVLIPWNFVEIDGLFFGNGFGLFKFEKFAKLKLKIKCLKVYLAINKKHQIAIESFIESRRT